MKWASEMTNTSGGSRSFAKATQSPLRSTGKHITLFGGPNHSVSDDPRQPSPKKLASSQQLRNTFTSLSSPTSSQTTAVASDSQDTQRYLNAALSGSTASVSSTKAGGGAADIERHLDDILNEFDKIDRICEDLALHTR